MGLTRKTILKRLEHIKLENWYLLNDSDSLISSCEDVVIAAKKKPPNLKARWEHKNNPHPKWVIERSLILLGFQLWGVPSEQVSTNDLLSLAPAAGQHYIKPVCMDRDIWLNSMLALMVLSSLLSDQRELTRFSRWFSLKKLQNVGTQHEMAHQSILYYAAELFRKESFESFEPLKKCQAFHRVKEPPRLIAALEGIRSKDEKRSFDNLIAESTDHAKRTNIAITQRPIPLPDVLALYPSLLWNIAELKGLCPPNIPPEVSPFMLTRQTLHLPPICRTT